MDQLKPAIDRHQYALKTTTHLHSFPDLSRLQRRRKRKLLLPERDIDNRLFLTYRQPWDAEAYVAGRMPAAFSILQNVLREIQHRRPAFQPTAMLDYGTGPATGMLVAEHVWGESLKKYLGVDQAKSMLAMAERMLKQTEEEVLNEKYQLSHFLHPTRHVHSFLLSFFFFIHASHQKDLIW